MSFSTILGVTEILCGFILVLEGKTGKEIPESPRLEFSGKVSKDNFALSDAEGNTSDPLNRGGIADLLGLGSLDFLANYTISNFPKSPESQVSGK